MPALISVVAQSYNNLGLNPPIYTETFKLTAAQVRTLNSVPVVLLPAPGANIAYVPLCDYYCLTQGSVVFSDVVTPNLLVGSVNTASITLGTGAAAQVKVENSAVSISIDFVAGSAFNAPLRITAAADVTGGTGSVLTVIVTFGLLDMTNILP